MVDVEWCDLFMQVFVVFPTSKHDTLTQSLYVVGPPSTMLAQIIPALGQRLLFAGYML